MQAGFLEDISDCEEQVQQISKEMNTTTNNSCEKPTKVVKSSSITSTCGSIINKCKSYYLLYLLVFILVSILILCIKPSCIMVKDDDDNDVVCKTSALKVILLIGILINAGIYCMWGRKS